MTSGHSKDLPNPPIYLRSALHVPPFFSSNHPYTKWMLNMIRGNAHHRLNIMAKERPELFQQYYQIADQPDKVSNTNYDTLPLFHERCVLYLTPLGLAIYLKRDKAAEMLLKTGVNHPHQSCYATEVYSRGARCADILELFVACVALRREYFEAIPLLCNVHKNENVAAGDEQPERITLKVHEPIYLRYENRDGHRLFRYRDLLHYATETTNRRPNFPLFRLLDLLLNDCPDFYAIDGLQFKDTAKEPVSVFRRLARMAFYHDADLRMCHQLISSLTSLVKNRCCPWHPLSDLDSQTDPDFIEKRVASRTDLDIDQDASLALLCGLYQRIREKTRNGALDHMGQLISHLLFLTRWRILFLSTEPEKLQPLFKGVGEHLTVSNVTLLTIQKHMEAIIVSERDREMVVTADARLRREKGRSFRSTCCLVRDRSPSHFLLSNYPLQPMKRIVSVTKRSDSDVINSLMDLNLVSDQENAYGRPVEYVKKPGDSQDPSGSLYSYRPEDVHLEDFNTSVEPIPTPDVPEHQSAPTPEAVGRRPPSYVNAVGRKSVGVEDAGRPAAYAEPLERPTAAKPEAASPQESKARPPEGLEHRKAAAEAPEHGPGANRNLRSPSSILSSQMTRLSCLVDSDRNSLTEKNASDSDSGIPLKPSKPRVGRKGDEEDELENFENEWQELEQITRGMGNQSGDIDASLIEFINSETCTRLKDPSPAGQRHRKASIYPKKPPSPDPKGDSLGPDLPLSRNRAKHRARATAALSRALTKNASNNFTSDEEPRPSVMDESETVYDESVNRFDIDAYEDCVLHEMLEDFSGNKGKANVSRGSATISTATSQLSMPIVKARNSIYGIRKYNHNQRCQKQEGGTRD